MKNQICLTEQELKQLVTESVNRVINEQRRKVLNENTNNPELVEQWFYIQTNMGAEDMNGAILKALPENMIEQLVEMFKRVYEIDPSDHIDEDDLITNWGDHNYDI